MSTRLLFISPIAGLICLKCQLQSDCKAGHYRARSLSETKVALISIISVKVLR